MTRKVSATVEPTAPNSPLESIDELMGNFSVSDHSHRVYKQIYYAVRELQGYHAKRHIGEDFDWETFKLKFANVFGSPEEPKFTKEQLLGYAMQKFGKTEEQLIAANQKSWERRRFWEAMQSESDEFVSAEFVAPPPSMTPVESVGADVTQPSGTSTDDIPY